MRIIKDYTGWKKLFESEEDEKQISVRYSNTISMKYMGDVMKNINLPSETDGMGSLVDLAFKGNNTFKKNLNDPDVRAENLPKGIDLNKWLIRGIKQGWIKGIIKLALKNILPIKVPVTKEMIEKNNPNVNKDAVEALFINSETKKPMNLEFEIFLNDFTFGEKDFNHLSGDLVVDIKDLDLKISHTVLNAMNDPEGPHSIDDVKGKVLLGLSAIKEDEDSYLEIEVKSIGLNFIKDFGIASIGCNYTEGIDPLLVTK